MKCGVFVEILQCYVRVVACTEAPPIEGQRDTAELRMPPAQEVIIPAWQARPLIPHFDKHDAHALEPKAESKLESKPKPPVVEKENEQKSTKTKKAVKV